MTPTLYVLSGTQQLAVYCHGDECNPPLVMVHGYPDDHGVWDDVVLALQTDFYVVTYDVRGAGASSLPRRQSDYQLEQLSTDLLAVLDAVSLNRPVHLVAHDWGSIQTWESVTNPALRTRIASFTSISGPCLDHMGFWLRDKLLQPRWRNAGALIRQLMRSWYVMLFHLPGAGLLWTLGLGRLWPHLLSKVERLSIEQRPTQSRDGKLGVQLYRANFRRRLWSPRPRPTDVPVQLIIPEQDLFVGSDLYDGMSQWVSSLWLRRVSAGHWLPLQQPVRLAGMIRQFVMAIESGDHAALEPFHVRGPVGRASGKVVLVTGAGSGIGRATALAYAEQGASVVIVDINQNAAERTAVLIRLLQCNAWVFKVDVGNLFEMEDLVQAVTTRIGVPDVVVNNAGIGMAGGMLQTSVGDWEQILHVNLWGVIHGASLFGRAMSHANNRGHIVNVASAAAFTPSRTFPAYATSKAAVLMLSECLRAEYGRLGIRVNTICPGFVETGIAMSTHYVGVSAAEAQRRKERAHRLYQRRGFTPEQVAQAIVRAVERNKPLTLVGIEAVSAYWLQRMAPTLSRWFARIDLSPS